MTFITDNVPKGITKCACAIDTRFDSVKVQRDDIIDVSFVHHNEIKIKANGWYARTATVPYRFRFLYKNEHKCKS